MLHDILIILNLTLFQLVGVLLSHEIVDHGDECVKLVPFKNDLI